MSMAIFNSYVKIPEGTTIFGPPKKKQRDIQSPGQAATRRVNLSNFSCRRAASSGTWRKDVLSTGRHPVTWLRTGVRPKDGLMMGMGTPISIRNALEYVGIHMVYVRMIIEMI